MIFYWTQKLPDFDCWTDLVCPPAAGMVALGNAILLSASPLACRHTPVEPNKCKQSGILLHCNNL
jgi:hypothetical protein